MCPRPTTSEEILSPGDLSVCVFDLDHTLVSSPLDLRAVAREMETFLTAEGLTLPPRPHRWSAPEMFDLVRREAPHLEAPVLAIPVAHERRAMEVAVLEPFAVEAVKAIRDLGLATAVWTNNDRVAAHFVLDRYGLREHFDLVVTRDEMARLKPDPDGLRVVRERWPGAAHVVVVGDSWVDGAAAQAAGVPFIAYRGEGARGGYDEIVRRGIAVSAEIFSLLDLPVALG
jgi:phosphoglycolate phosphatase